jgi:acetyltransferase-like isoleucine patch superfamily enzyme
MPVHYTRNDHNIGPWVNIVNCYKNAKGRYIWVLSDDDYLFENAISYIVSIIQNNKDYGLLWHSLHSRLKAGYKEYPSKRDFFSNIDYMLLWISGSILRTKYVQTFPFDKYGNEHWHNWHTSAMLNIHVILQAEYNVLIGEKIIATAGHGGKTSGGPNIFKIETDLLSLIKENMRILRVKNRYYERSKKVMFDGMLRGLMVNILFKKERQDYKIDHTWLYLFKYYWYEPYFYPYLIYYILKYRFRFFRKITALNNPLFEKQIHWRRINPHNETIMACDFEESRVFAGVKTTGDLWVFDDENSGAVLRIGNNCTIGQNVHFFLSGPGLNTAGFKGNIVIGNNVKIGRDVIVYSGISIGDNVTICAGSKIKENRNG